MRVALSGAPGTGKTTLAARLSSSFTVHAVRDLAEACGALGPVERDGASEVDVERLLTRAKPSSRCADRGPSQPSPPPDAIVCCDARRMPCGAGLSPRVHFDQSSGQRGMGIVGGVHVEVQDAGRDVPVLELDASALTLRRWWRVLSWSGEASFLEHPFIDWLADSAHLPS